MLKPTTLAVLIGLSGLALAPASFAADGAALFKDKCSACHGKDGNSTDPKVPSIAGFPVSAITDGFEAYKSGDRTGEKYKPENGEENDMNTIAKEISDSDLKAIAEFIASQTFKTHDQSADPKLAKKGAKLHDRKCEKCHSEGGSSPEDDAPLLAGQWREYLTAEFDKFKSGERTMPKKMKKKFKKLNEKQMKALIEFYANGGGAK